MNDVNVNNSETNEKTTIIPENTQQNNPKNAQEIPNKLDNQPIDEIDELFKAKHEELAKTIAHEKEIERISGKKHEPNYNFGNVPTTKTIFEKELFTKNPNVDDARSYIDAFGDIIDAVDKITTTKEGREIAAQSLIKFQETINTKQREDYEMKNRLKDIVFKDTLGTEGSRIAEQSFRKHVIDTLGSDDILDRLQPNEYAKMVVKHHKNQMQMMDEWMHGKKVENVVEEKMTPERRKQLEIARSLPGDASKFRQ